MKVLVPGGGGYIGAVLVPWLLADGHEVTVYDTFWFGNAYLPDNGSLTVIRADVRNDDLFRAACEGKDAVIYLASISNNDFCNREPLLSDDVNRLAFERNVMLARVPRFIYASSVAAYGSSDEDAKETQPLCPTTLYGHAKHHCEAWLLALQGRNPISTIVRCASVCGYSPRQRFDLTVNMMVRDAMQKGVITVNGGAQKRSHIHIQDACDFYRMLLKAPAEKISGQVFNIVQENASVAVIAKVVAEETGATLDAKPRSDDRSYTVDGAKALRVLGFSPRRSVRQAVLDIKARFDSGMWKDAMTNQAYMNMADGLS